MKFTRKTRMKTRTLNGFLATHSLNTPTHEWITLLDLCLNHILKLSGVVILHIENKSAPLRGQKIINPPQNRAVNFQKFPYF